MVLASVIKGSLGTKDVRAPAVTDFKKVDEKVGTIDDVKKLIRNLKKKRKYEVDLMHIQLLIKKCNYPKTQKMTK